MRFLINKRINTIEIQFIYLIIYKQVK